MTTRVLSCFVLLTAVAGCVAPEPPPAPRSTAVAKPAISTAGYEDAPLPNRKLGAPANDSIVRMGK